MTSLLRDRSVEEVVRQRGAGLPAEALAVAADIVEDVRRGGELALRRQAERFAELRTDEPIVVERPGLEQALGALDSPTRERLERVTGRIRAFAEAQRGAIRDVVVPVPGGGSGGRRCRGPRWRRSGDRGACLWCRTGARV